MSEDNIKWDESMKSTLRYLESCLVERKGKVEERRLNQEDFSNIELMKGFDLIEFEEIPEEKNYRSKYTHKVRFSDEAWNLAHKFRKEKSERMIEKEESEG